MVTRDRTTITLQSRVPALDCSTAVIRTLEADGYHAVRVGVGRWHLVRAERPTWMRTAGVLTLPLLGLGALLLSYSRESSITLLFTERHDGVAISASGDLTAQALTLIRQACDEPPPASGPHGVESVLAPTASAVHGAASDYLEGADSRITGGSTVTRARVTSPAESSDAPVPAAGRAINPDQPLRGWSVAFDTGQVFDVTGPLLVGRAPTGTSEDSTVTIADPAHSVSATHFRLVPRDQSLLIVDCDSTNGTGIIRGRQLIEVLPGEGAALSSGDVIAFGARRANVLQR